MFAGAVLFVMGLQPFQFNFNFLGSFPIFFSISSFSLQFRVASLLEAQIMIWQLDGNLRTVKFENMDIWDQLQGLVYQTVNVDTYNLIK